MNRKNFYYTNPAFSQQSEFHNGQASSAGHQHHQKSGSRQSPIGAQTPLYYLEDGQEDEEQEFYEEMLVDEAGIIKQKKVLMVSSPPSECSSAGGKNRYEYIPMQVSPGRRTGSLPRRVVKQQQTQQRSYQYVEDIPPQRMMDHRYELISDDFSPPRPAAGSRYDYMVSNEIATSSPKRANPVATQKLYELLQTPKKYDPVTTTTSVTKPIMSPQAHRRSPQTPKSPASPRMVHRLPQLPSPRPHDPFLTPSKQQRPKAQQKLNYALASQQQQVAAMRQQDKRHTAIVAPMCSSPIQSVYSEMTFSKSESWMNLRHHQQKPTQLTLAVAAMMMTLCGGVTSGLCFYMISVMGRLYFLDFGTVAGFMCLVLGLLGFRTRNCYWLPNRNYISGYIVMSVLSLLMCAGLLVLLVLQPKPGTPLADMTSGAVCGISVLSLVLASMGVISSYCCKYPPPDNRVQHCAQGFVV